MKTAPRSPASADVAVAAIRSAVRSIPKGRVATYGQIATLAGLPGRARLVGRSLQVHADEEPVPWYRVIAAGGRIALPRDSAGFREQCALLEAEGVQARDGRVDMEKYQWRRDGAAPVLD